MQIASPTSCGGNLGKYFDVLWYPVLKTAMWVERNYIRFEMVVGSRNTAPLVQHPLTSTDTLYRHVNTPGAERNYA